MGEALIGGNRDCIDRGQLQKKGGTQRWCHSM
jgi:hypothetical protein